MRAVRQSDLFEGAPRRRKKRDNREHQEQAAFIQWCRWSARQQTDQRLREALEWIHSIPNGADLSESQRRIMNAEGRTAGIHDLRVDYVIKDSSGAINCPGLIIEMKLPGNNYTEDQNKYRDFMHKQGFRCILARNWQEAARSVIEYMQLKKHAPIYP